MWHGGWGGWGWMTLMPLFWIVLIGLIVWVAIRLSASDQTGAQQKRETPQEMLDRRFTAGEVDVEEYMRARDLLAGRRPQP